MIDSNFLKTLLADSLKMTHEQVLEGTIEGVDNDLANRQTPGKDNPIGTTYAHAILSEDAIVNAMLAGGRPLSEGEWKDKTGVDQPMPLEDADKFAAWYQQAKVDMSALREYAKAVYAASESYIESLSEEDLEREVELWGMKMTVASALNGFVINHASAIAGEISALKGVAGLKGYPF